MSSFTGKCAVSREGGTITILPARREYDAVVVISHGLGDSAEGFADVGEMFCSRLNKVKFVLPTAPNAPVTINGGMRMNSWYDLSGLSDRAGEACEGIEESAEILRGILKKEHDNGIPYSRMMLAGFSQGGAMSIFTGMQMPAENKLAGILCMSGYLAGASKFKLTPGLESTPVLHCHGTADPMVRFEWAQDTEAALKGMGATDVRLRPYQGMAHTVYPEELEHGLQFIKECIPSAAGDADKAFEDMSVPELKAALDKAGLGADAVGLLEKQDLIDLAKSKAKPKDEL